MDRLTETELLELLDEWEELCDTDKEERFLSQIPRLIDEVLQLTIERNRLTKKQRKLIDRIKLLNGRIERAQRTQQRIAA